MKYFIHFLLIFFAIFAFTGCSRLGFAVVLWPPEESHWQVGDIARVKDESILRDSYLLSGTGDDMELDTWRVKLFSNEKEAISWAADYQEWRFVYAESTQQGLPVRSEASNTASRVYHLREGETVKVLDRTDDPVEVGNLTGHWYEVITEGGVRGFAFDYRLQIFRFEGGQKEYLKRQETTDSVLEDFLNTTWRPEIFLTMVKDRTIDLDVFRPEYGLFPDPGTKTLTLRLKNVDHVETWSEIVFIGRSRYDFLDTSFRITLNGSDNVRALYKAGDRETIQTFSKLETDMEALIEEERKRRETAYRDIMKQGPSYESRVYGEVTFGDDAGFLWTGKSSLISQKLISLDAGNRGRVIMDHHPAPSIADRHTGVLNLRFDSGETALFLYAFEEGGLRMIFVPERAVEKKVVQTDQFTGAVRLFFLPTGGSSSGVGG